MGIRIQPREIEIPAADPFKYDLLDRKEPITVLTHIIGSIEGPCVLAVDAPWGAGKTTFLKIWEQYLRNEEFPVVSFNAWETDFSDDPFIALSDAISQELKQFEDGSFGSRIDDVAKHTIQAMQWVAPVVVKAVTGVDLDIAERPASDAEKRLSGYREALKALEGFRNTLRTVASDLAKSKDGLPLVIVIDELDRCRPSYAVELLEVAKHIFVSDHIVFVLAVNRSELAHSVRSLYGSEFDAIGYLNRFFDIDFRLPDPSRRRFIESALEATSINNYFQNVVNQHPFMDQPPVKELLKGFCGASGLSIRAIAQSIHRLGLVLASERTYGPLFVLSAVVALIVRAVDPVLYQRFIRGEIEDTEVVDLIYCHPGYTEVRWGIKAYFDAAIVVAIWELSHSYVSIDGVTGSSLLKRYEEIIKNQKPQDRPATEEERRAREVLRLVKNYSGQLVPGMHLRFGDAVQRIELLSAEVTIEH